jgi:bisphosphoglycerate-independent phosphoglycerate mutase (AlkP superfamily)
MCPAGVHSRYDQLKQFIDGSVKQGAKRIRVHILTDGRDVPVSTTTRLTASLGKHVKALHLHQLAVRASRRPLRSKSLACLQQR